MINLILCLFVLSGCTSKYELDTPQSRAEKREFSFGSILENTSFFKKKDEMTEKLKVDANILPVQSFEKLCSAVSKTTGATISIANAEKGILLTDWFYNDKQTTRHSLQVSVKQDIEKSDFLFVREDLVKGRWVPKSVNSNTVRIIQNDVLRNFAS
jgi:hypothetical protein